MTRVIALLLTVFVFVAATMPAHAQTPVTKERANAYFAQCMGTDDDRMSEEAQIELCSCASARMMERMTMEQLDQIGHPTATGKAMMHKMLATVYGPCLQTTVRELLHAECMRDSKIEEFKLRDKGALCTCMSNNTANYLNEQGEDMMDNILLHNPDITDPLPAIMGNPSLRQRANTLLFSCLSQNNAPQ